MLDYCVFGDSLRKDTLRQLLLFVCIVVFCIILANVKLDIGQETRQENERKHARTKRMWMARPAQTKPPDSRCLTLC